MFVCQFLDHRFLSWAPVGRPLMELVGAPGERRQAAVGEGATEEGK